MDTVPFLMATSVRLFISVWFVVAGAAKLLTPHEGSPAFLSAAGFPNWVRKPFILGGLAFGEISVGSWLATEFALAAALRLSSAVLLAFAIAFIRAQGSGYRGSCGCFGRYSEARVHSGHLVITLVTSAGALMAAQFYQGGQAEALWSLGARQLIAASALATLLMVLNVGFARVDSTLRDARALADPPLTNK